MCKASLINYIGLCVLGFFIAGCTGVQTFGTAGRAGDTIAIATGWNADLTSSDITIQITDSLSVTTPLTARAVVNAFPDPLSNLIIESFTDVNFSTSSGNFWGPRIEDNITNGDTAYSQQVIFFDLPLTVNPGAAQITVSGPGFTPDPIDLEVLPLAAGTGASNAFGIQERDQSAPTLPISMGAFLRLGERAPHNTVTFTGATVPHAIEITMTHNPDFFGGDSNGGVTYVTSPRADVKNISWSDDGTQLTVIMMPTRLSPVLSITDLVDFKFYVAGGITGLTAAATDVKAFDVNGNAVPGINCMIDGIAC